MVIGPVQLLVFGFQQPTFSGEILAALEQLRDSDMVRVIDSLIVRKDASGAAEVEPLSNLTEQEAIEFESMVGALIGLELGHAGGAAAGAQSGAGAAATGVRTLPKEDLWDVIADIPEDSAAAVVLLEHHWAVPLRDALIRAGGYRVGDAFVSPVDLVEIGLMNAAEGRLLHEFETSVAGV